MTETSGTSTDELEQRLDPLGAMNFRADCTVDGTAARLTMNSTEVFVVRAHGVPDVGRGEFGEVSSAGEGDRRAVTFPDRQWTVTFPDAAAAERFDRVLRVRQSPTAVVPTVETADLGPAAYTGPPRASTYALYRRYADDAMTASMLLLVLAWLDLVAGVVIAFVLFVQGNAVPGLVLLFAAVAGCAVPLCLGSLTRAVIMRHRMQDEA